MLGPKLRAYLPCTNEIFNTNEHNTIAQGYNFEDVYWNNVLTVMLVSDLNIAYLTQGINLAKQLVLFDTDNWQSGLERLQQVLPPEPRHRLKNVMYDPAMYIYTFLLKFRPTAKNPSNYIQTMYQLLRANESVLGDMNQFGFEQDNKYINHQPGGNSNFIKIDKEQERKQMTSRLGEDVTSLLLDFSKPMPNFRKHKLRTHCEDRAFTNNVALSPEMPPPPQQQPDPTISPAFFQNRFQVTRVVGESTAHWADAENPNTKSIGRRINPTIKFAKGQVIPRDNLRDLYRTSQTTVPTYTYPPDPK